MDGLKITLLVLQVICALCIIALVLLQQGKGAEMGAAFGSGASGSLFGASGSANFFSRTTAILAALFFIITLSLTYLNSRALNSAGVLGKEPSVLPGASALPNVNNEIDNKAKASNTPKSDNTAIPSVPSASAVDTKK